MEVKERGERRGGMEVKEGRGEGGGGEGDERRR